MKRKWLTAFIAGSLGIAFVVGGPAAALGQSRQLPPVPKAAEDAYLRAWNIIERLTGLPDRAAGSAEWDVAIKRLAEAQSAAPESPQILLNLGLAHQLRGRASAAAAWLQAAAEAIRRIDARSPDLGELAKRIATLREAPKDQMELALTFAYEEIPYLHAKKAPFLGARGELWPPQATPPLGPVAVDLGGGNWTRNPDLYNKDGSPKPQDVPRAWLEMGLIGFRLSLGDVTAIKDAETYYRTSDKSSDILSLSLVRLNAYDRCLDALKAAECWPLVARVAGEAADWCDKVRTAWTDGHGPRFRGLSQEMSEAVNNSRDDRLTQWIDLAQELSRSDDEVYFQAKIAELHKMTDKGEALLEGIAGAVRPIAHNLLRLQSIPD
jgi:hypothetical protein